MRALDGNAFIGNAAARGFLAATLAAGRTSHAYLLTGPPSSGKRTLARWYAASAVCTENVPEAWHVSGVGGGACGKCRACQHVGRDTHPDVRLIQPEGGRRGVVIEQVRQLEHDAALRPYEAQVKVFIIAGADAMTDAAANALLKTLEEPPDATLLVLTATDPSQLLPTIASRCQEIALRAVPSEEIEGALLERGAVPERAKLLARLAGGRPGWAIAALSDDTPLDRRARHVSLLEGLLGEPPELRLAAAANFSDASAGREAAMETLETWQAWWRDALLVAAGCDDLVAGIDRLAALRSAGASTDNCRRAVRRIQDGREHLSQNANVRLAMEGVLLDLPVVPALAPAPR